MCAAAEDDEVKLCLRVMINKERTKVLFAEVDSSFADVLLSFLTLPLGTIVRLFEKHYGDTTPVIGCLNTLRNGLANLDSVHFWTKRGKMMLLNPRSSFEAECRKLKLNIDHHTQPTKYFSCGGWKCDWIRPAYENMDYDTLTCSCGYSMYRQIGLQDQLAANNDDNGVFTINKMSFLISDDLRMVPNVTGSIIQTLEKLGISNMDGAEERTVTVGFHEIMDLLRGSLLSKTPLTDFMLSKRQMASTTAVFEFGNLLHQIVKKATPNSKTMIVKVMVQKSTNKLLFAQAEEDFIDFLFSFLTIPLGRVESLLDGNTSLGSIDNLYRSIANINGKKYLKSEDTKNKLLKPELPPKFVSKNQIFSITERTTPLYYIHNKLLASYQLKDAKGGEGYVKGPRMFMVSDDLTVTPLCMLSSLSILNELKIPLLDVKEVDLHIGLEEGLSILRASLTSTCALTDGLKNYHILNKQPKDESESDHSMLVFVAFQMLIFLIIQLVIAF